MARIFAPIVPPTDPNQCAPWLNRELRRIGFALNSTTHGQAAIVRGEMPDGSGSPLIDSALYFYKPGLSGGQLAYGGKGGGENLTLSSTAGSPKGKIYLGSAQGSAFDEVNGWLGLGSATPAARLHLVKDANSVYQRFETTTFTVASCTISGTNVTTTATFTPTGGPRVVAGMLVTGTGVSPNTYVKDLVSGTSLTLTQSATAGTVVLTFQTVSQFEAASDETGGHEVGLRSRGAVRFIVGPPNAGFENPVRLSADIGVLVANAAETTRTYMEVGYLSSGNAIGTNLQVGGPGHGELNLLKLRARFTHFDRNPSSGTTNCVGINQSPLEFGSGGPSLGTSLMIAVNPLRLLSTEIVMHGATAGTSPAKTLGEKVWSIETDQNIGWWTGSAGVEVRAFYIGRVSTNSGAGARQGLRMVNQQANPSGGTFANNNVFGVTPALEWATIDVSPSFTTRIDFGDNNKGMLTGQAGAKMTRFGICSDFVTIASATSQTIPLGLGLLHLELTGTTATVGQIIRAGGAQTADFFQIRNSSNTVVYAITSGILVGINTATPTNDLSFGGEAARKIWMERRTAANVAGNNLSIQAGGASSGGTNRAGGTLILMAGVSTGSSPASAINFQTATPGSSGTADNTLSTKLSIAATGGIVHTVPAFVGNGMSQVFTISSGISGTQFNGNSWAHTLTNIVDSVIYGLQMQLNATIDSTDSGGSALTGFGFEIYENGESGTGVGATAIGGFIRHSSTATGLGFTGCNMDVQVASGAGACDVSLYVGGGTNVAATATTFKIFYGYNPTLTGAGAITTLYGLHLAAMTSGTTNWAIYSEGGQSAHVGKLALGSTTAPAEQLDLYGNIKLADSTNGTKIGTATSQKLGFWNATPIAQPTTAVAGATLTGGGGTTLTDTDTFDGYTLKQVVKALRNMGLLA